MYITLQVPPQSNPHELCRHLTEMIRLTGYTSASDLQTIIYDSFPRSSRDNATIFEVNVDELEISLPSYGGSSVSQSLFQRLARTPIPISRAIHRASTRRMPIQRDEFVPTATDVHISDCSICLEKIYERQRRTALPCGHTFHALCVETWLRQNSTCPLCRQSTS